MQVIAVCNDIVAPDNPPAGVGRAATVEELSDTNLVVTCDPARMHAHLRV